MFCKRRKSLVWLLAIYFLLTQIIIVSPIFAQSTGTDRISGADRYKTAVAVSQKGWKSSDYAVLARGDNFADALCAGPLAQKYGGPILLTQPNQLNTDTLKELQRLGVKHLFIAGGVGAVSQSVENALKTNGIATIERIYGNDRYGTSVKIAEKIGIATSGSGSGKVVLATGSDFPDALSISGIAAKLGMPILLTAKNTLPASVSSYFQTNTVTQTYVVGGTGVISAGVVNSVPGSSRLAGNDRYATNVAIMQNFASELNFDNIYVAIGHNFADALTGAVLAAKSSAPLVLTGQTLPAGTAQYLQTQLKLPSKILGLGGRRVVSSAVLTGLVSAKEQIAVEEKYSTSGTYGPVTGTKTIQGSVIISSADVTLRNTIIEGDLLLGRSIGDGDVSLRDVTVKGKTIINGGGPNSVIMYNFNGQTVIVDVPDGASVRLVAQGDTSVGNVSMESNGTLEQSGLTGTGFVTVQIPAGAQVILNGDFNEVNVEAAGANVIVQSGNISTLNISETAEGSGVDLASGSSVGTLNANAQSNVTGQGQITNANVNAAGVTIAQTPTTTVVAEGHTAVVGGQQQSGTSGTPPAGGGGGGPVSISDITVTGVDNTIAVVNSETLQMSTVIAPANATNKNVTWSIEAGTGSATIDEDGLLTATGIGTVTVKATAQDGSGKIGSRMITIATSEASSEASLKQAVQDATEGDIVLIRDTIDLSTSAGQGPFTNSLAGLIVDKNITIVGADQNATITCSLIDGTKNVVAIMMNAGELKNIKVTRLEDLDGPNLLVSGIYLKGDSKIIDSSVKNFRTGVEGTGNNEIVGNFIEGNRTGVIYISRESVTPIVKITGNTISDNRTFGILFNDGGTYGGPPNYAGRIYADGYSFTIRENRIYGNWFAEFETRNLNSVTTNNNYWGEQGPVVIYDYVNETLHPADLGGSAITSKPDRPAGGIYQPFHSTSVTRPTTPTYMNFTAGELTIENYYPSSAMDVTAGYSKPPIVEVDGITVTGSGGETTVINGETLQMTAAISPSNATSKNVTWSVQAGTGTATINSSGLLTATGIGTVIVTASAIDGSGETGTKEITVAWGVTPSGSIQQVINSASPGDTVKLKAGTYDLSAPLIINKAITVKGVDREMVILKGASNIANTISLSNGATLKSVTVTRDNSGIWSVNVNNSSVAFGQSLTSETILENCIVKHGRNGVYLNNTANAVIRGNIIDNNRTGIQMANSASAIVENNVITNNHTMGVLLQWLTADNYGIPTFTSNIIQNNWYSDFENRWPTRDPQYNVDLRGNTFTDSTVLIADSSGEPGYNDLHPVELGGDAVRPDQRYTFVMKTEGNLTLPQ